MEGHEMVVLFDMWLPRQHASEKWRGTKKGVGWGMEEWRYSTRDTFLLIFNI